MIRLTEEAAYWFNRAERETAQARNARSTSEAISHRNQAQRYMDIAFAKARTRITDPVAKR